MADENIRKIGKPAADYAAKAIQQTTQMKEELLKSRMGVQLKEKRTLEDASDFFKREFSSKIQVWQEDDKGVVDPKEKARFAEPYRPAIYVE